MSGPILSTLSVGHFFWLNRKFSVECNNREVTVVRIVLFRPEIRWDWSDQTVYNDPEEKDIWTAGFDFILRF